MEQLYLDDYLGATEDIKSAKRRVTETNTMFSEAKLNMRGYATNCEELRQYLEDKGLENQIVGLLSPTLKYQQKVLGKWSERRLLVRLLGSSWMDKRRA